jgi:hypothetical protein
MTFHPDDPGEQPGGPWSQRPQYPPPYRRASYPNYPGYPPTAQPGYQDTPGYQGTGEPDYAQTGPGDYRDPYGASATTETPGVPDGTPPGRKSKISGSHSAPAFTGLVLGMLGLLASFLAPILAIVFGVAGLTRIRRTGQRGGAIAITGILLGIMWIVLTGLFAVLVIHNESYGSIAALHAGSCFDNAQPGHVAARVRYLSSCAQPHNGEVVGTFALTGTAWPGQRAVSRAAANGCAELLTSVLGQQRLGSGVRGMNYSPNQQAWSTGTRAVSCVLLDPDATHTGSMLAGS